jgi:hypothetical protein
MPHHLKKLDEVALARLEALEGKTGKCVVAFEVSPQLDDVSEAELKEIRSTEKEMNAVLVAYACPVDNL